MFRDRVLALTARGGQCSEAVLLGHAIAHELGHLLLGTSAHARYRLMAGRWRNTDLDRASVGLLLFSPAKPPVCAPRRSAAAIRAVWFVLQNPSRKANYHTSRRE